MIQSFSLKRIGHFIIRDITILRASIVTSLSVAASILFIVFLFYQRGDLLLSPDRFASVFGKLYIILGILFTFKLLKEAQYQKTNHLYFALPISSLERVITIWFTASILYTIVFSIVSFIIGQSAILTASMFSDADFHLLSISDSYWNTVRFYFLIQPIFLYGALRFNKNRLGKTLLFILLLIFTLIIFNMMLYGMLNYGYDVFSGEELASEAFYEAGEDFSGVGQWVFTGFFITLLLLASYFRFIEKEV
ncbi:hypothetical protein [Aquimarina sp. 2201CG5-10]|uniref:hypothetical protein n=1 Tax=Aquimarina callyspongiae TaxID=3098150 RepID=UPI002AB585D3|nr:hypothetical protein [Aquimarina sp. 2201CG5-10]MDY8135642.1 hypothetical protein [Aquimarina sp. 2201CG5-10]